ncbi:MAG: hypothetical protein HYR94_09730 [Chloroflexi bacterium]|nr:hypothetical protein [Chloroflexota bacterium]
MRVDFNGRKIKTIFLDVRGTVLSPWDDAPMPAELCQALGKCLEYKINLVIATATSLASTGMGFVIEPLLVEFHRRKIDKSTISSCLAYIESGTVAYRFDSEVKITPLENFEFLAFTEEEKEAIEVVIPQVCTLHGRAEVKRKIKPGQVNCYVGGPWIERRRIADEMNDRFQQYTLNRLVAQVPSARETIDVAVSTKSRMVKDYLNRSSTKADEIVIIGDSLQRGGNDELLSQELPGSIAVQVGEIKPDSHIFHAENLGPRGVLDTVVSLLQRIENK